MANDPDFPPSDATADAAETPVTPAARPSGAKPAKTPPMSAREEWSELFRTAFIAIILAVLVRTFLLEPFNIPSGSMKPTLEVGDYLFVSKPAYGFSRYSFPFGMAPIEGRVMTRGHVPERGDVVVFKLPTNTGIDYIKRVIGLPGDRIQVTNGRLLINGVMIDREEIKLRRIEEAGRESTVMEYLETLPNGVVHHIYEEGDNQPLDNTDVFTVPEGHYFMMGDNRDNSQDSRVQDLVGFVPLENIVGRATRIFFSTNGYAHLGEIWKWPWSIRYDRIFDSVRPLHGPVPAAAPAQDGSH